MITEQELSTMLNLFDEMNKLKKIDSEWGYEAKALCWVVFKEAWEESKKYQFVLNATSMKDK